MVGVQVNGIHAAQATADFHLDWSNHDHILLYGSIVGVVAMTPILCQNKDFSFVALW